MNSVSENMPFNKLLLRGLKLYSTCYAFMLLLSGCKLYIICFEFMLHLPGGKFSSTIYVFMLLHKYVVTMWNQKLLIIVFSL
jgi:hypothetical protein